MRVLVTGGAGFIGSHIVDALVADGHEVRVLDCLLPSVHDGTPNYVNPDAEMIKADLRDARAVDHCVRGVDAVCHQASMVGLEPSFDDAPHYVGHNDLGTAVLLSALDASGFDGRFVLGSSMVVYGEGTYRCRQHGAAVAPPRTPARLNEGLFEPTCPQCGADLDPGVVTEDLPVDPRNVYAATKLQQEQLCRLFGRVRNVPVVMLRYHNVYGARMPADTPYSGVASVFRSALEHGEPPSVFEDGKQLRDFVSVEDVARANVMALSLAEPHAGTFNISTGEPQSVGEMASLLAGVFGGPAPVITGAWRAGDVRHIFASPRLARVTFGWTARIGFEEGITRFATEELRPAASGATGRLP